MRKNKYVPAIILLIAIFAPSCFAGTFWITNMSSTDSIMGMGGENDTAIEPHDVKDAAKKGILGRDPWIVDAVLLRQAPAAPRNAGLRTIHGWM